MLPTIVSVKTSSLWALPSPLPLISVPAAALRATGRSSRGALLEEQSRSGTCRDGEPAPGAPQQCPPPGSGAAARLCEVSPSRKLACGDQRPFCIVFVATCYLKSKRENPFLVGTWPFPPSFWVPLLHSPAGWPRSP